MVYTICTKDHKERLSSIFSVSRAKDWLWDIYESNDKTSPLIPGSRIHIARCTFPFTVQILTDLFKARRLTPIDYGTGHGFKELTKRG